MSGQNKRTRSCVACSERKGMIFLMVNKANLQDRAVLVMWSEKVSWSSIITPRFLAGFEGVMVDEPNWKVKLWWNDGFAETTCSSVLARLSWRWWSFIQQEMSVRHAEMRAAIVRSSGWNESKNLISSRQKRRKLRPHLQATPPPPTHTHTHLLKIYILAY